jgi:hypothetical protein
MNYANPRFAMLLFSFPDRSTQFPQGAPGAGAAHAHARAAVLAAVLAAARHAMPGACVAIDINRGDA